MGGIFEIGNETDYLFRHFDTTPRVVYLFDRIKSTNLVDLRQELDFILRFDQAFQADCRIIDMPDRRTTLLAQLELQNNGKLSAWERYESRISKAAKFAQ